MYRLALTILTVCFISLADGNCPENLDIKPCGCKDRLTGQLGHQVVKTTVTCRGPIGLPKLSKILMEKLCSRHVDEFQLVGSDISYLPSNLFYNVRVKDIKIFTTNVDHFTEAGRSAFYGLEKTLTSLAMRQCGLVDGLQWQKIGELDALLSLDLSQNNLTTVPAQWFENPPRNLKFLYLRGNKITAINSQALSAMYQLMYIDLSENFIVQLQRSVFPNPGNSIVFLKLSYNELTDLEENFFSEMFGLRRLYLDNNNLQTLDFKTWSPIWSELVVLDLMGNDLVCDCDLEWVSRLYPVEHLYGKCGSRTTLQNRELKSLQPWDFNCTVV